MFLIFLQSANAKRFVYAPSQRGLLNVFAYAMSEMKCGSLDKIVIDGDSFNSVPAPNKPAYYLRFAL